MQKKIFDFYWQKTECAEVDSLSSPTILNGKFRFGKYARFLKVLAEKNREMKKETISQEKKL